MEHINSCDYCGSLGYGLRCSSCGAPLLFKTLSINEFRIGVQKQKTSDINISEVIEKQLDSVRDTLKKYRGGYRL